MSQSDIRAARNRAFKAKYDGRCSACGDEFETGDFITMIDGETVHAAQGSTCIETALDEESE